MKLDEELLAKLDKELTAQTRNGRDTVYIDIEDLNKLGYGIDPNKKGRVWVDATYLRLVIKTYKFKGSLQVPEKNETFNDLEKDIKSIETRKIEDFEEEI